MAATASGMLGRYAATLSPTPTPAAANACCKRDTRSLSSRQDRRRVSPSSPRKTIASPSSFRRSRFSAKFSLRIRKEPRARHLRRRRRESARALLADDAAEVPDEIPERAAIFDRPSVQRGIVGQLPPGTFGCGGGKARQRVSGDAFRRGAPQWLFGIHAGSHLDQDTQAFWNSGGLPFLSPPVRVLYSVKFAGHTRPARTFVRRHRSLSRKAHEAARHHRRSRSSR